VHLDRHGASVDTEQGGRRDDGEHGSAPRVDRTGRRAVAPAARATT
jgi:hypothetical protein